MTHGGFDWNTLYLTCFVIGLVLSLASFLTGAMHLHVHFGHRHFGLHKGGVKGHGHQVSAFNAFTLMGFLCWFGGAGYLLNRYSGWLAGLVLLFAVLCGLAGGAILMWFLTGVLIKHERTLEPEDTEIVGVLGRVSQKVPARGVGEMLYTQNGARRSMPVRSADGTEIARETEVVVMSHANGVASVRRWSEFEDGLLKGGDGNGDAARELQQP